MKIFLVLLVALGCIHSAASAATVVGVLQIIGSILPGLLTAIAGGLLAVMSLLDSSHGRRTEDSGGFFAYPRVNC
jgi:hypothetical protein